MKMHWKAFARTVGQFAPLILAATPLAPIAPMVALAITKAQTLPHATGAEKLALARDEIKAGIAIHNALNADVEIVPVVADAVIDHAVSLVVDASKLVVTRQLDPAA
jgi:hypothetical protein